MRKDTRKMDYRTGRRLPIVKMKFDDCKFPSLYCTLLRGCSTIKDVKEIKRSKKFSKYLAACNVKIALPDVKNDVYLPPFVKHVHKGI